MVLHFRKWFSNLIFYDINFYSYIYVCAYIYMNKLLFILLSDVGEGYYEPIKSIIYNYKGEILRTPSE